MTIISRNVRLATLSAAILIAISGCAITRGQSSTGAYIDDTGITTAVKARFIEDKSVDAASVKVETLNGTVLLSGFAKNSNEKATAESLAWRVGGVKSVRNEILVRP